MLINCIHCGKSFSSKKLDNRSQSGTVGVQHSSGGCSKWNKVHFKNGNIIKIT